MPPKKYLLSNSDMEFKKFDANLKKRKKIALTALTVSKKKSKNANIEQLINVNDSGIFREKSKVSKQSKHVDDKNKFFGMMNDDLPDMHTPSAVYVDEMNCNTSFDNTSSPKHYQDLNSYTTESPGNNIFVCTILCTLEIKYKYKHTHA